MEQLVLVRCLKLYIKLRESLTFSKQCIQGVDGAGIIAVNLSDIPGRVLLVVELLVGVIW